MSVFGRGRFLQEAAVSGAALAIVSSPGRAAQFEYKSGHTLPVDHPQHVRMVQLWNQVARETNGRLIVRVFPAGQLGGQESVMSQVRLGAIQFLAIGDMVFSELIPAAAIDSVGFAFKDAKIASAVMLGPLGDYVRKEFEAKNLYVVRGAIFDLGMRQITSGTRPIRNVDDFAGFKIRVPPSKIVVDLFATMGASSVAMDANAVYTGLQTHIADGQDTPYLTFETQRLYEVQRYLSVTNHLWSVNSYVANIDAWKALPSDIQAIAERNIAKYAMLERNDVHELSEVVAEKLRRQGMIFNVSDTQSMRARLGAYYARWKRELGSTAWGLLEDGVGRLG